ncbi:MAG: hypothetical protein OHK0047_43950 [Leptolyngbyaceae cyanobacterium]
MLNDPRSSAEPNVFPGSVVTGDEAALTLRELSDMSGSLSVEGFVVRNPGSATQVMMYCSDG